MLTELPDCKKEVKNGKKTDMPLKIVTNELLTKSAVGYSVIDLMRERSHIDLLGHLFDVFTKYMQIGGSTGDIVKNYEKDENDHELITVLPVAEQEKVILAFQEASYSVYNKLINSQKK